MSLIANVNGKRSKPLNGVIGECLDCKCEMLPVMGEIYVHHWRHKTDSGCISKGETIWHLQMKSMFDESLIEIKKNNHRADVLLDNDTAIEFQMSSISNEEIISRNNNYEKIIWVFNLDEQYTNGQISKSDGKIINCYFEKEDTDILIYKRPKTALKMCMPNLFLYFNGSFYYIVKIDEEMILNKKTGYNDRNYILHYFEYEELGFIDNCYSINDKQKTEYNISLPKFAIVNGKNVSYFDTRFIKVAGINYELTGTHKKGYDYFLDVKNLKTKETKTLPFETVVSWHYL